MKIKKILSLLLTLLLITSSLCMFSTSASENSDSSFSGTRSVSVVADKSDIENFINGGRSALELLVRLNAPDWMTYKISSDTSDLYIKLTFDFSSLEDYISKTKTLLNKEPSVVYDNQGELLLMEAHNAMDLFSILSVPLTAKNLLSEKDFAALFTPCENSIVLEDKEYKFDDNILIAPDDHGNIKYQSLDVMTTERTDGIISRRITVEPDSAGDKAVILKNFGSIGEVSENGNHITVSFSAFTNAELTRKTMLCIGMVSISEQEEASDNNLVTVRRTEFFDLENILVEGGYFSYLHTFSQDCKNITVAEAEATVSDSTVTAFNQSVITCIYNRKFRFDSAEINTDFSNGIGEITRTVTFTSALDKVQPFHEMIYDTLKSRLTDGCEFDIKDEGGSRKYIITYSAWSVKKIKEFTDSLFPSGVSTEIKDSWIPFKKSTCTDYINWDDVFNNMAAPAQKFVSYSSGNSLSLKDYGDAFEYTENADDSVRIQTSDSIKVSLEYKRTHLLKLGFVLVVVIIIALLLWSIVERIKTAFANYKAKTPTPAAISETATYNNSPSWDTPVPEPVNEQNLNQSYDTDIDMEEIITPENDYDTHESFIDNYIMDTDEEEAGASENVTDISENKADTNDSYSMDIGDDEFITPENDYDIHESFIDNYNMDADDEDIIIPATDTSDAVNMTEPNQVPAFCPECGHPIEAEGRYCSNCAFDLKDFKKLIE